MRNKGKLTSWDNKKGFGFITPDTHDKQVFVHISSFVQDRRRPELNQAVSYTLSTDSQGRFCAVSVLPLTRQGTIGICSYFGAFLFLTALALAVFVAHKVPALLFWYYLAVSLFTFMIYAKDKSAAQNGSWRIAESTLHFFALIGGWPGALIAQQKLRHKSKKQSFRIVFYLTLLLNCGVLIWLLSASGSKWLSLLIERIPQSGPWQDILRMLQ